MITFFIITGTIIVAIIGFGLYRIQSQRPKFFKGNLKPLEKRLFEELKKDLSAPAQQLLAEQLANLKRGCRLYFEKSYSLELYEDTKKEYLFPRKDDSKLGTITFQHNGQKYTATFPTYHGRIWGIQVRPSPKQFLNTSTIEVIKRKILNDPMEGIDLIVTPEYFTESENLPQLLKELKNDFEITKIKKALPENKRVLFIKTKETKLPEDFLELTKATDGFEIGDIQVYGLSGMESVAMDDNDYLKLVETTQGVLTIQQSKQTTRLKYFSFEDRTATKEMGERFMPALKELVKQTLSS